jgi:hypothetical protein
MMPPALLLFLTTPFTPPVDIRYLNFYLSNRLYTLFLDIDSGIYLEVSHMHYISLYTVFCCLHLSILMTHLRWH